MSSAHVYLRTKDGESWEDIPEVDLMDCCQLVKANSIKGCKLASVKVVYTPWSNLRKTPDMVTGQIGFTSEKLVCALLLGAPALRASRLTLLPFPLGSCRGATSMWRRTATH